MTETVDSRDDFRALLRRLWAAVLRYRGMVAVMFVFGALEAVFTKLPLLLVQPLFGALGKEKEAPTEVPGLVDEVKSSMFAWFDDFALWVAQSLGFSFANPGMNVVVACAVIATACGVLGAVTIYLVQTYSRMFAVRIVADLRGDLAQHFLNLPLRFYGKQRMGELISKVTNDTQVMQRSFELAADNIIVDPLLILGNVVIVAWCLPQALWILLLMVPLMGIPLYRQGKRVQKRSTKSLQAMGETTESLNQILSGIRTVKAFQIEPLLLEGFRANTQTFLDRTKKMLRAKGRSMAQTFVTYNIGFAALLVVLGWVVLVDKVPLENVIAVIAPLSTTYQNIKRLTRSYHVLRESSGALKGIEDLLATPQDQANVGGKPMPTVRGEVELRDVWFGYDVEPVLRGIDLRVRAGQTVALVGETGSGKSTLMDLLLRFHDVQKGAILVDGEDLREVRLADYRAHTAVVSQQAFLFNTTIRANIEYGRPGAPLAQIEAAARAANIHDFIVSLPNGYDTPAGERGSNLSGGQIQRITIARAILRDPAILFLDEATSALDSQTEEMVQKAIDTLRKGRTSFVIAHRLSTIVGADLIVVLHEGRVVESGTHAELVARDGRYRRMYELQVAGSAGRTE